MNKQEKTKLGKFIFERLKNAIKLEDQVYVVERNRGSKFEKLVAIILSQNTNDVNAKRALENLKREVGIDPKKLANENVERIAQIIKSAGLHKQKAKRIKELARLIVDGLDLEKILNKDTEEARKELMKIPGIGSKTADVFLAIHNHKTFGIDTHINRIVKRLGIVGEKATYEEIRKKLMDIFEGLDYDLVHRYLIAHGRVYCTARKPRCGECPIRAICEYAKKHGANP